MAEDALQCETCLNQVYCTFHKKLNIYQDLEENYNPQEYSKSAEDIRRCMSIVFGSCMTSIELTIVDGKLEATNNIDAISVCGPSDVNTTVRPACFGVRFNPEDKTQCWHAAVLVIESDETAFLFDPDGLSRWGEFYCDDIEAAIVRLLPKRCRLVSQLEWYWSREKEEKLPNVANHYSEHDNPFTGWCCSVCYTFIGMIKYSKMSVEEIVEYLEGCSADFKVAIYEAAVRKFFAFTLEPQTCSQILINYPVPRFFPPTSDCECKCHKKRKC